MDGGIPELPFVRRAYRVTSRAGDGRSREAAPVQQGCWEALPASPAHGFERTSHQAKIDAYTKGAITPADAEHVRPGMRRAGLPGGGTSAGSDVNEDRPVA
jgi:hypothetical protein